MFSRRVLAIDAQAEADVIATTLRQQVQGQLGRRGLVVALSGGVDSSVVAALAVRALGAEHVLGLLLPERHSAPESTQLAQELASRLGIVTLIEDIAPILAAAGCYARQCEAIRTLLPDFQESWPFKLTLPPLVGERLSITRLVVARPDGITETVRLSRAAYLQIVAATNFKQRTRKMLEYYHADRLGYAVAGTPNRLEYDQGFFVKQGDGCADVKPIAHLYKTQVYALAEYLAVPLAIRQRPPTTDTFPLAQSQEEFYFALPYERMDVCMWALDHDVPASDVAPVVDLSPQQVELVFRDIRAKRRVARYLHEAPLTMSTRE